VSALEGSRVAGILAHPTSLPGGSLGPDARAFADWLAAGGFSVWQTLPVGIPAANRSPYDSVSAFAGGVHLIDLTELVADGLLGEEERHAAPSRAAALARAHARWRRRPDATREMDAFRARHGHWLEDFALYASLAAEHGTRWWRWPEALAAWRSERSERLAVIRFAQLLFERQWQGLRRYAHARGVRLFGDLPMFVSPRAADVWARPERFLLAADGRPRVVAGVPPDAFSAAGQRWGNPMYDWDRMAAEGFTWWRARIQRQLELFDLLRLDHFRALAACWHIPAEAEDARQGHWEPTPGAALLESLGAPTRERLVAEDLGTITEEVHALRERFALPGMHVLQFAFDDPESTHLPHNHRERAAVYTGTHDNDTTLGWWHALDGTQRERVLHALGRPTEPMPWPMIDAALGSPARLAMLPLQDPLALDSVHRMNVPGTETGNWRWRFAWSDVPGGLAEQLRARLRGHGRLSA